MDTGAPRGRGNEADDRDERSLAVTTAPSPIAALVVTRASDVSGGTGGGGLAETRASVGGPAVAPVEPGLPETRVVSTGSGAGGELEVTRGTLLGRYVALDRLGAGAMGVVFAAFDPELDRKVAIKLLRPGAAGSAGASHDGRTRLVREALALAKLSHPNVVAIFDVGTHGEAVWIAMELVEGRTLRAWLAERPREWREVLAVMRAAGLGLAAAHAAGLVHRDIKPDNVMIAADGRVRVMDFGLARGEAGERVVAASPGLGVEVTLAGSLIGTPAYMASEQLRGEHAGPPADVFAFCVMLWEGLHGARPFAGETLEALRDSVAAGRVSAPPRERRVPRWIDEVLRRGLAADPARRWPGMAALLAALDRGQARARRRRWAGLVGGVIVATAGAAIGSQAWRQAELAGRVAACAERGAEVEAVWDAAARTRLQAALAGNHLAIAAVTAERTTPWLDAWATEWRRVRVETCELHTVRRAWSTDLVARADECLEERLLGFTALLGVLGAGDDESVLQAVGAAAGLPAASVCGEARQLERRPALPAGERGGLLALRERLARASALEQAGRYHEGLAAARAADTAAEALGWAPAAAEAQLMVGLLEERTAAYAAAEKTLAAAYFAASRASADDVAADAARHMVVLLGDRLARPAEGMHWAGLAELGLLRTGSDGRTLRDAYLLNSRGLLHKRMGDYPAALADLAAAREILAARLPADHPNVVSTAVNLAIAQAEFGERAPGLEALAAALSATERAFGPDHPSVANQSNTLGTFRARGGDLEGALAAYRRGLAIRERVFGPDHPYVAESLVNIASASFQRGDTAGIEETFARILAIQERAHGRDHPDVADTLQNLGFIQDSLGKYAEAERTIERALTIRRQRLGAEHVSVAVLYNILGLIHRHTGDLAGAWQLYRQALAIREKGLAAGHPEIAATHRNLAYVAARRGEVATARAQLDAAASLPPAQLAEARFAVAQAWWAASPGERAAARGLAELARDGYAPPTKAKERAEVEAWLAGHPAP